MNVSSLAFVFQVLRHYFPQCLPQVLIVIVLLSKNEVEIKFALICLVYFFPSRPYSFADTNTDEVADFSTKHAAVCTTHDSTKISTNRATIKSTF